MKAWLKRFSLHLAAAVGATGIFVTAAAVGASQTRQQAAIVVSTPVPLTRTAPRKPTAVASPVAVGAEAAAGGLAAPSASPAASTASLDASQASPSPQAQRSATPAAGAQKVIPERSIAGSIRNVSADGLEVLTAAGKEVHVNPVPGALIRLNGKAAKLDQLAAGDVVVILGQAQPGPGQHFLAHAITARRT